MKVLVTGGNGVVGQVAVTQILAGGHSVRLLSRNAAEDARQWPAGVELWPASIGDQNELRGGLRLTPDKGVGTVNEHADAKPPLSRSKLRTSDQVDTEATL